MPSQKRDISAASVQDARDKVSSDLPEGWVILSENVIYKAMTKTVRGAANTRELAYENAKNQVPNDSTILSTNESSEAATDILHIQAFDKDKAIQKARKDAEDLLGPSAIVEELQELVPSKHGFLGIGRKSGQYDVKITRESVIEITFQTSTTVSFEIADASEQLNFALTELPNSLHKGESIVSILDKIGWQPPQDALGAMYWIAKGDFQECARIGSTSIPSLVEFVITSPWHLQARDEAIAVLKNMGPTVVNALQTALTNNQVCVPESTMKTLSECRSINEESVDELLANIVVRRGNADLSLAAAHQLSKLGKSLSVQNLNEIVSQKFSNTSNEIRLKQWAEDSLDAMGIEPDADTKTKSTFRSIIDQLETLSITRGHHVIFFSKVLDYDHDLNVGPDAKRYSLKEITTLLVRFLRKDPRDLRQGVSVSSSVNDGMLSARWSESYGSQGEYVKTMQVLRVGDNQYLRKEGRFERGY